jgi:hypothetical protein
MGLLRPTVLPSGNAGIKIDRLKNKEDIHGKMMLWPYYPSLPCNSVR